mmetsp:Transcript_100646/g.173900  ORF Transcript_100646/g.173900 Transcript_100646/m.173900 type:complete len:228 (+) Transcript_100646:251-934(+)
MGSRYQAPHQLFFSMMSSEKLEMHTLILTTGMCDSRPKMPKPDTPGPFLSAGSLRLNPRALAAAWFIMLWDAPESTRPRKGLGWRPTVICTAIKRAGMKMPLMGLYSDCGLASSCSNNASASQNWILLSSYLTSNCSRNSMPTIPEISTPFFMAKLRCGKSMTAAVNLGTEILPSMLSWPSRLTVFTATLPSPPMPRTPLSSASMPNCLQSCGVRRLVVRPVSTSML